MLLFLVLLAAAGCGGQAPLKVSPQSASTTASGDPVTLSVEGASGTVSWSLSPELGSLSASSGSSVVYYPPERVEARQTVTVTATSAGAQAQATITVDPLIVDVAGTVLGEDNLPLAGLRVAIPGMGTATTDADGRFAFAGVIAPYDVVVENTTGSDYWVFCGLLQEEPVVYSGASGVAFQANVEGNLVGTSSGNRFGVTFVSDLGVGSLSGSTAAGSTSYSGSIYLFEPLGYVDGYALEWTLDADGHPDTFVNFGKVQDVPIADGGTFTIDFSLSPVTATNDTEVNVYPPADGTLDLVTASVRWPGYRAELPLLLDQYQSPSGTAFTFRSPAIEDAKLQILAKVVNGAGDPTGMVWQSAPTDQDELNLDFPAQPQLLAPADGASDVTPETRFTWDDSENGVYLVAIYDGPVHMMVFTDRSYITLPDLSDFGLGYDSGDSYDWQVAVLNVPGMYTNMRELTSSGSVNPVLLWWLGFAGTPLTDSGLFVISEQRSFTIR
ncbi:hypothetical protein [Oceanithermus sp.]